MNNGLFAVAQEPINPIEQIDPSIAVSMVGDIVVLSPRGRLDLDATHTLVQAVDAASCSDRKVVIDLDGSAELSPAELLFRTEATPPNGVPMPVTHRRSESSRRDACGSRRRAGIGRSTSASGASVAAPSRSIGASSASTTGPASATCGRRASAWRCLTADDAIISTATPWVAAACGPRYFARGLAARRRRRIARRSARRSRPPSWALAVFHARTLGFHVVGVLVLADVAAQGRGSCGRTDR